eukprot:scaffold2570_cov436-Prasinococcus_capsulatus_cf.AAC.4
MRTTVRVSPFRDVSQMRTGRLTRYHELLAFMAIALLLLESLDRKWAALHCKLSTGSTTLSVVVCELFFPYLHYAHTTRTRLSVLHYMYGSDFMEETCENLSEKVGPPDWHLMRMGPTVCWDGDVSRTLTDGRGP